MPMTMLLRTVNLTFVLIAWITRNVICKSKEVMKKIYICLIRPHLEYCVQLWSPVAAHGSWGTIYDTLDTLD